MARQQPPERGPVALNDVVSAALDLAGYAVRTSGIDVKLDLGSAYMRLAKNEQAIAAYEDVLK